MEIKKTNLLSYLIILTLIAISALSVFYTVNIISMESSKTTTTNKSLTLNKKVFDNIKNYAKNTKDVTTQQKTTPFDPIQ